MKSLRLMATSSIALFALTMGVVASASAAQSPAWLAALPGTWNCSANGPDGKSTSVYTFETVNPDTVQWSSRTTSGKYAGNKGAGVLYYDTKKSEYVTMGAGNGWGVSRGKASATATTITMTDTYPTDPTNGTTVFGFTSTSLTSTSNWKKDGKPMHSSGECTKT